MVASTSLLFFLLRTVSGALRIKETGRLWTTSAWAGKPDPQAQAGEIIGGIYPEGTEHTNRTTHRPPSSPEASRESLMKVSGLPPTVRGSQALEHFRAGERGENFVVFVLELLQ